MLKARLHDHNGVLIGYAELRPARAFPQLIKVLPLVESHDKPISSVTKPRFFLRRGDSTNDSFDEVTNRTQSVEFITPLE